MKYLLSTRSLILSLALAFACQLSFGQKSQNLPHLGYAYPAGGQRGSTIEITIGGRYLGGAKNAFITGAGVKAEVVDHFGNYQRRYKTYLRDVRKNAGKVAREQGFRQGDTQQRQAMFKDMVEDIETVTQGNRDFKVPDHHYFNRIAHLTPEEFQQVAHKYMTMEGVQTNNEIAELATLRIHIAPDAPLGNRELRLRSYNGYSNPIYFQVGGMPEQIEIEPNDQAAKGDALQPPFTQNGQIMPGDLDRIRFTATKGQKLVLNAQARQLVPYLADAVPGWFQAILSLHDEHGKEIAYVDDYLFHPDPVILFDVPEDGVYEARIRDSIFRGREDFVYRISVAESPFITSIHPLGGELGVPLVAKVEGWNLPSKRLRLKSRPHTPTTSTSHLQSDIALSNLVRYETTRGLNLLEDETNNNSLKAAQAVQYPCTISGRIDQAGDRDVYQIEGQAGQALVAEVRARRLHSPVDSTLQLFDSDGVQIAWNDDIPAQPNVGVLTHHADSLLDTTFPKDGTYYLQISDTQNQGGPAYGYRLQVGDPEPDFKIWAYPAIVQIGAGQSMVMTAKVNRTEGFQGPIHLEIAQNKDGFSLSGATIPAGQDEIEFTITAPRRTAKPIRQIKLIAVGEGEIEDIQRPVVPCEQRTQAFITPHLIESREFLIETLRWPRGNTTFASTHSEAIELKDSGPFSLKFKKHAASAQPSGRNNVESFEYELRNTPPGVTLTETKDKHGSVEFSFIQESKPQKPSEGNLVIDVYAKLRNQKSKNKKVQTIYLGTLPAVPYKITM
ncbi:PPC domain-containing protein [Pelagicoccus mobilis]|uniref:PPC domain-containing protein n=1 Tax=Pelagicoccus mobilis TaxID=415221 RepID=A0A934RXK1_9BACT|nr:PPC domain-containing protein [Pelagicoccus mobilis]MBK1876207.1 PPC domain-containing protein [Pelagicoccus mobilis]